MKTLIFRIKHFINKIFKKNFKSVPKPYMDERYKGINHNYLD